MAEKVNYATNIALVNDDGIVENIIWGMFYSVDEYSKWGYRAIAVHELAVQIGDRYDAVTEKFYNEDGEIVKTVAELLNDEIESLDNFIIDTIYNDIIGDIDAE